MKTVSDATLAAFGLLLAVGTFVGKFIDKRCGCYVNDGCLELYCETDD